MKQPFIEEVILFGMINITEKTIKKLVSLVTLAALILTLIPATSWAAFEWTERQPAGDVAPGWSTVSSDADGSNLIAGNSQRLYTSADGGVNWTERQPAGSFNLSWSAVASDADGTNLIAAVNGGRLYTSSDSGVNWTERQPAGDVTRFWRSVASDDTGTNLVAASQINGRLYTSADGGVNWTERQPAGDVNRTWFSVASDADGTNLIAAISNGRLYTSSDSGVNWTERQPVGDVDRDWRSVTSDDTGTSLVAGSWAGRLYSSSDSGVNWTEEQPAGNVTRNWVSSALDSTGSNLIVGADRLYTGIPDITAPSISSTYPEDNETNINTNLVSAGDIQIEFDEDVIAGIGNVTLYDASDDSIIATFDVTDGDHVSISDQTVALSDEEVTLERETTYYVHIDEGAFEDVSGNAFVGISDSTTWNFTIRLFSGVTIDETFITGDGFNEIVYSLAIQDDGKIVVGGSFNEYDGDDTGQDIARLNTDGSLDETFVTGDGFNSERGGGGKTIYTLATSEDQILVGGSFIDYNGTTTNKVARLNSDGSLDETFVTGDGFDEDVYAIAVQDDGKIIVGGDFTEYNGTTTDRIARLNTDGSLDESFASFDLIASNGFDDVVRSLVLQDDGKIIVGGDFTTHDATTANSIARLNSDGSLDNTFITGDGFNEIVYSLAIQDDGKIVVGGSFNEYDGDDTGQDIARLNTDGSLDETFVTGDGFNSVISGTLYSVAVQDNGQIVVGGNFFEYDGDTIGYSIARLNTDGSLDEAFTTGDGFNEEVVYALALQADGKIIVGGDFTAYDGDITNNIARLVQIEVEDEEEEEEEERHPATTSTQTRFMRNPVLLNTPDIPLSRSEQIQSILKKLIIILERYLEQLRIERQGQ